MLLKHIGVVMAICKQGVKADSGQFNCRICQMHIGRGFQVRLKIRLAAAGFKCMKYSVVSVIKNKQHILCPPVITFKSQILRNKFECSSLGQGLTSCHTGAGREASGERNLCCPTKKRMWKGQGPMMLRNQTSI